MRLLKYGMVLAAFFTAAPKMIAQPDLSSKEDIQNVTVYKDVKLPSTYYYTPGDLKIQTDSEGKPEFRFIMMRYTGTNLSGDSQTKRFRNLIQFKIIREEHSQQTLKVVKQQLIKKAHENIKLKPVPVRHVRAVPIYVVPGESAAADSYQTLENGYFTESEAGNQKGSYWSERTFTIRPDNLGAQAFNDALSKGQTILSVGYAFYAEVANPKYSELTVSGTKELAEKMKSVLPEKISSDSTELSTSIIKSGAFSVTLDLNKFPDLIKTVDINEQISPEYAALNIYCFDFNNGIRPDLHSKRIEIEATSVNGSIVSKKYTFKRSKPDIYAHELRFPYAIRIDKPYKYRIVVTDNEGEISKSKWKEIYSWHEILDITTGKN